MRARGLIVACIIGIGTTPAIALDLNTFRVQHKKPPLEYSSALAAAAQAQARAMAGRKQIDHKDFRARMGALSGGTFAENVAYGCPNEDCVIKQWAKSPGHRANMLRGDVSAYGLASADGDDGRRYWALELGN